MTNNALMVNVSKITDCDFESIIQSLITNVDEVWINALSLEINTEIITKKLLSLKEAGLIKFWDYELSLHKNALATINRVITSEEYEESNICIQEMMQDVIKNTKTQQSDFTTFNIEKKNLLSNFMIAKYCDAGSLIQRNTTRVSVSTGEEDLLQIYSQNLFNQTNIYSVSGLSIEEILELRKYSKYFREKIQEYIDRRLINGTIPISAIRHDCESISREYCEEVNSRIKGGATFWGTGTGVALDIASIWLVPVTLYSIGQKLWDSIFHKEQRGFVMYLTTLQKSKGINSIQANRGDEY